MKAIYQSFPIFASLEIGGVFNQYVLPFQQSRRFLKKGSVAGKL